jgi:hypothetical protein
MIGDNINTWYFIRLMFGTLGYMVCKVHDRAEMFRMSDTELVQRLREERDASEDRMPEVEVSPQTS